MVAFKLLAVLVILAPCAVQSTRTWDSLKTTFALDGALWWFRQGTAFQSVPRTISEAGSDWRPRSTSCINGGQFNGLRYTYKDDGSINVLFDKNGVIVGIQMNINVTVAHGNGSDYKYEDVPMFQKNTFLGVEVYTLTAYFTDPATICTTGRATNALTNEGTGDRLSFQNGPTPADLINVPRNRAQALAEGWSNNKCFVGMGVHNWYKQEEFQLDGCKTLRPAFLLYDQSDDLIGYGFQHVGKSIAPRFEQPDEKAVKMIVGDAASECLLEKARNIGVTTMHVYFISNPLSQTCL